MLFLSAEVPAVSTQINSLFSSAFSTITTTDIISMIGTIVSSTLAIRLVWIGGRKLVAVTQRVISGGRIRV